MRENSVMYYDVIPERILNETVYLKTLRNSYWNIELIGIKING